MHHLQHQLSYLITFVHLVEFYVQGNKVPINNFQFESHIVQYEYLQLLSIPRMNKINNDFS
jgi:hypothetical protein